jgi:hypothetical protein
MEVVSEAEEAERTPFSREVAVEYSRPLCNRRHGGLSRQLIRMYDTFDGRCARGYLS